MTWQFWLDVGGTFTDCLARTPDGKLLRRKVLSSGVTKGRPAAGSTTSLICDSGRDEPDSFWRGYGVRLVDALGEIVAVSTIENSSRGQLVVKSLSQRAGHSPLTTCQILGYGYELVSPEEAPLLAIRLFRGLGLGDTIPPCTVRLGTTRGTNALLTWRGAKTAFVTTRGFADILKIGYQNRPKLFELNIKKAEPLFAAVAEIDERVAADGGVIQAPTEAQIRGELVRLKQSGIESLAICLLNSYANPLHEQMVEQIARDVGFEEISVSSCVSPLMKIVPRGDTTVVDAYLNPVLRSYVERLAKSLPGSDVGLMTSAGGLARAGSFTGKDSLLSGPAGGVVGFSKAAEAAGFAKAIGFDMGGTSTDVSRYDGRYEYEFETEKAGVRVVAPMLAIETVAAGGGSICKFDGMKLVVGPDSAGADPGPACYGRGGPLTVTDCNLLLGRLVPEQFPFPLDVEAARKRLAEVVEMICREGPPWPSEAGETIVVCKASNATEGVRYSAMELAAGFLQIANANMAAAIRSISLAKGYDPREYCLVAFGAAGPQHACAVAAELGITRIMIHPDAGVLSALGIGMADVVKHRSAAVYRGLEGERGRGGEGERVAADGLESDFADLEARARAEVVAESISADRVEVRRSLDVRYQGTDAALRVPQPEDHDYAAAFAAAHQRLYGYMHENRLLEVVAARVEAVGRSTAALAASQRIGPVEMEAEASHEMVIAGQVKMVPLYHREKLRPGVLLSGPAIVVEPLTTIIVDPGWEATVLTGGDLLMESISAAATIPHSALRTPHSDTADPIMLELFNNHLTAIATQMGITLRNTSMSVNVKERLDFSCAIFTADGDLVVNAPHIPVHLGAMSKTVKQIIADNPRMQPGDVFVTNDPYRGGSHLPDVTVVTPVFEFCREGPPWPSASDEAARIREARNATEGVPYSSPLFFTASRAHHAEIGGITPGSMPPFSKNLGEEGVLIRNFKLIDAGHSRFDELRELLTSGPYPSRSPDTNLADITAQVAANQQGVSDLQKMVERYSLPVVQAYMRHIQEAAERKMRAALARLTPGRREFTDHMDDGTPIQVTVTIHDESATIDFTGTGPVSAGNLNANRSIVTAAVMYVLRLLIGEDIPLNQGVLKPIKIVLPVCLLNPINTASGSAGASPSQLGVSPAHLGASPSQLPAVVGGNVETSQRVVDVLLGAFGLAAASQGTMNNLLFGDETFGYYETICGGSGATAEADGADAVHTHMTNTRLTDPEVLESRYPVRLREFSIRCGSGGAGEYRGGDGIIRRLEFLKPLTLSILSQRRGPYAPYGLDGGKPGGLGSNCLKRADGAEEVLGNLVQTEVRAGDVLTIETPGGGGFGESLRAKV
ncbi:MAG TPA: hydantoinase B/oxoprolinase family protein [Pirellulaceae bacterium]